MITLEDRAANRCRRDSNDQLLSPQTQMSISEPDFQKSATTLCLRWIFSNKTCFFERFRARPVSVFKGSSIQRKSSQRKRSRLSYIEDHEHVSKVVAAK